VLSPTFLPVVGGAEPVILEVCRQRALCHGVPVLAESRRRDHGPDAGATFAWDAVVAGYEDVLRRAATRARPDAAVVQR